MEIAIERRCCSFYSPRKEKQSIHSSQLEKLGAHVSGGNVSCLV